MVHVSVDELIDDPHPLHHRWRAEGPIVWVPALGGWVVTERTLAIEIMRDDIRFTVDDPRFTTGSVVGPSMLSLDGRDHRRHRAPFADSFRDRDQRRRLADYTSRAAAELVAAIAPRGSADLRREVAGPLAATVMSEALGLGTEPAELLDVYRSIVAAVEARTAGFFSSDDAVPAMERLAELVSDAIDGGSPLLVQAGETLDRQEVVSNVAVVLFGGVETSEDMIASTLWMVLAAEGLAERIRAAPSTVHGAVEEAMRMEPAATRIDRYATEDVVFGTTAVHAGDLVIISLAGANRDPAMFEDPDRFDADRLNARSHLTFATGRHACIATHLARVEVVAAVTEVLGQLPNVRLTEAAVSPTGLVFRRPEVVPVRWDAPSLGPSSDSG